MLNRFCLGCSLLLFIASIALSDNSTVREWSDASGSFKVKASFLGKEGQAVKLKKSDGLVIKVPISKLSEADQKFLSEMASAPEADPFAGGVREELETDEPPALTSLKGTVKPFVPGPKKLVGGTEPIGPIEADSGKALLRYRSCQTIIAENDAYKKVSRPIVMNPEKGVFAVSIGGVQPKGSGKIYISKYGSSGNRCVLDVNESVRLLDYHQPSDTAFLVCGEDILNRGGEIVLLKGLSDKPIVMGRYSLPGIKDPGFKPTVEWASFINESVAVFSLNDSIHVADFNKSKGTYHIPGLIYHNHSALSPNGKYLAVPASGVVAIVDTLSGDTLGTISLSTTLTPELTFDPSGSKIALEYGRFLDVWNLKEGKFEARVGVAGSVGDVIGWVKKDLILTSLGGLIDTNLEVPVWNYNMSADVGHMIAVNEGLIMSSGYSRAVGIKSYPVPHPAAEERRKQIASSNDYVVDGKMSASIQVETVPGIEKDEVYKAVQHALEQMGWSISDKGELQIIAKIGRAATKTIPYTLRSIGANPNSGQVFNATITPFTAAIELRKNGDVLWSANQENAVPSSLFLHGDETVQDAVRKFERPSPEFFRDTRFPKKIVSKLPAGTPTMSRPDESGWVDFAPK